MKLEPQALKMVEEAERYRAEHCNALLAEATAQSRAMLRQAQVAARQHLRSALAPDLARLAAQRAADEARLGAARRAREHRRIAAILQQAWPLLAQSLCSVWQTPARRACWVMRYLSLALAVFPAEGWVIQHPEHWPAQEREQASQWLQAHGIEAARFDADPALLAGVRVVCGPNVLDGSSDGLLADRTQVEGRLLHYLARQP